eukprot:TRINITY_DN21349_c0_g1_i1.p2 TRINITY_DN21349_c0_g1~~TRINITY_DN21349_c0_g1_i1.p2  ORF type:complete len:520 (+),score=142.01 TRINITY_DN21349_c0_g1_i1:51-1610(+)
MKYRSTRGGVEGVSFADVILSGYAPDGGLYVPEALPQISAAELRRWRSLDFPALAEAVLAPFVGDELEPGELGKLCRGCYKHFETPEVIPVRRVGGVFVAELFHGPTYCFKDLGQQPLIGLLATFAKRRRERRTMLVATTGDTGPAAIRAVADAATPGLDIIIFYPDGQISELQRKQMTTCSSEKTCRVVSFEGGGDDMDVPLKNLAADRAFAARHGLVGINSYNLGRPLAQIVQYFWTYFRIADQLNLRDGDRVDVVIPCGALGNLAAAFMARNMGLPLGRLVAGTNSNDITHRTISTGKFHREAMQKTMSEAINIQVPYNMERILYYLTGEDSKLIASWMGEMDQTGRLTLPPRWHAALQASFASSRVDDAAMAAAMRRALDAFGYLADPHTAVALAAAWDVYGADGDGVDVAAGSGGSDAGPGSRRPVAVMATASPCKFEACVSEAVGVERWRSYAASAAFPASARAVLAAAERPPERFRRKHDLAATQAAWELEVRRMLEGGSAEPSAPPRVSKL